MRLHRDDDRAFRKFLIHEESYLPMSGLAQWAFDRTRDAAVREGLAPFDTHVHHSWAYDIPGAWCLPRTGTIIRGQHVLRRSDTYWHMRPRPRARSIGRQLYAARGPQRQQKMAVAASFRDPLDQNYWHFHDDLLGRLLVLDELGLGHVPLLIGPELAATPWFAQLRRNGSLADREWVVHHAAVHADRLLMVNHGSLRGDMPGRVAGLVGAPGPGAGERRILLTRGPGRTRRLANQAELSAALPDFDLVDTDTLDVDEQADLFAGAATVVAVHGAGLTNLLYRHPGTTQLLELFPADFVHPHFAAMARSRSTPWGAVIGTKLDAANEFRVDVADVLRSLARLASDAPAQLGPI